MLRDGYAIDRFFISIQELASEMDPELAVVDELLDDDELYQTVRQDMEKRHKQTLVTGRPSTPVEVVLRTLTVKALYHLSYEETEQQVKDSLVLRRFCRLYFEEVPDDTTLIRWANVIGLETMEALNRRVVGLATKRRVTRGRKLRTDGTVVESNIHYPTDNRLLADGVRVLSRTLKRAQALLGEGVELAKELFRDRTRSARRAARQITDAARKGKEATRDTFERLVHTTQATVDQAEQVLAVLHAHASERAQRLCHTLETFIPRVKQVINQTVRRVFQEEQVPAPEKLVSLFEPHTNIIRRSKANRDTEFGHKVWLDEVDGGIITRYAVLDGNPPDHDQWQPSLDHHVELFGHPPWQASADRGVSSPDNEAYATCLGVQHVILPHVGTLSPERRRYEQQSWFRRGRRWHSGIEGRISVVKRKYRLDRCLNRGKNGFVRGVGWGVFANNLSVMGHALA